MFNSHIGYCNQGYLLRSNLDCELQFRCLFDGQVYSYLKFSAETSNTVSSDKAYSLWIVPKQAVTRIRFCNKFHLNLSVGHLNGLGSICLLPVANVWFVSAPDLLDDFQKFISGEEEFPLCMTINHRSLGVMVISQRQLWMRDGDRLAIDTHTKIATICWVATSLVLPLNPSSSQMHINTLILTVVAGNYSEGVRAIQSLKAHTTSTRYVGNHRSWTSGLATCVALHTAPKEKCIKILLYNVVYCYWLDDACSMRRRKLFICSMDSFFMSLKKYSQSVDGCLFIKDNVPRRRLARPIVHQAGAVDKRRCNAKSINSWNIRMAQFVSFTTPVSDWRKNEKKEQSDDGQDLECRMVLEESLQASSQGCVFEQGPTIATFHGRQIILDVCVWLETWLRSGIKNTKTWSTDRSNRRIARL